MTIPQSTRQREMRRSWLVQRLTKPRTSPSILGGLDNAFAFGGGLRNGGLSPDAMNLLRPIFGFEYMGSAEFEFGAVPKALQGLAGDAKSLVAVPMYVPLSVVSHWRINKKAAAPTGDAPVYILCRKSHVAEVKTRVLAWAMGEEGLKESVNLAQSLRPTERFHADTAGWLELDNGFMFFTDAHMWTSTAAVFGIEAAS